MRRTQIVAGIAAALVTAYTAAAAPRIPHAALQGDDDGVLKPDVYRAMDKAYPNNTVEPKQVRGSIKAWRALSTVVADDATDWSLATPAVNTVDPVTTYTGRGTTASGRVTALALSPNCNAEHCVAFLGAAGGGVWRLEDPFGSQETWRPAQSGLDSMAIGSIALDPNGRGDVIYAGTGEPNQSGDSESGLGLYRSTDGGKTWNLLPASVPFSEGLAIATVVVDPRDSSHIYFGTTLGVHGAAAAASGRRPPNTAPVGLFESHDGGATFNRLLVSQSADPVFGGIVQIALDPTDLDTVYASAFGIGILRSSKKLDGDTTFRTVFATGQPADAYNRLSMALNKLGKTTRVYVADSVDATGSSALYRVDDARVPASKLNAGNNEGWISLSSATNGDPGFASYGFCEGQCWYDIFVASPPGKPDTVWIGGSMNYDEIFGFEPPRSNGRAVMRSTDAGVHFTDMTNDSRSPPLGMHPDQHAIVFAPFDSGKALVGSDGGVVRLDGKFVNASATCAGRGLGAVDLAECRAWLSSIPNRIDPLNTGLTTLQFQSVSLNPHDPRNSWQGGTQDNGTWSSNVRQRKWFESVGGDGGQSGFDSANPKVRFHSYYGPQIDINFNDADPLGWTWISDPLAGSGESTQFYIPAIADPVVSGTLYAGLQHVWRTQDDGGDPAYLAQHCNEYFGDFTVACGDWQPLGNELPSTTYGTDDRAGGNVVAVSRSTGDASTLWAATTRGRVFVSRNANVADPTKVAFERVDNPNLPRRGVTDIVIDPSNPNHAWISFTSYGAYTPGIAGHIYEVRAVPGKGLVSVVDISSNIGDMPVTALVRDDATGTLYAGTDFGVLKRSAHGTKWKVAGLKLPTTAVYHLSISSSSRILYAATHGRSVWTLNLED